MANWWTYCIWGFIGFAISGLECAIQSEGTPSTSTVCANGQHTITCGSNTVIAITEMAYGYKSVSSGCSTATGSCCTFDNTTDCLESSTIDTTLMENLSGKSDGIATIGDAIATTTCTSGYISISTFNRIRYLCIPQSRIIEMCTDSSYRSGDGLPVYIQNRDYQSGTSILATDTSCSISVEVLSRSTNAQLYTLHMQLSDPSTSCQQSITVSNGNNVVKTFDCTPAPFNQIQSENLTGNYFLVNFTNSKTTSGGKFWIGVKDASGNPPLVISSPAVPKIDCGALSNPNDGSVTTTDTNYGSVAYYTCATGYDVTSGNVSRTCEENATWSGNVVVCSYNCGNLTNPQNGFVSFTGTYQGHTATYGCNAGYVMDSGNINRSCIEASGWNGMALQCIFDCDPLTDPANGTVSFTTTTAGSQATYTCNASFVLIGQKTRTCVSGSGWSDSEPTCSPGQLAPSQSKNDRGRKLVLGLGLGLGLGLLVALLIAIAAGLICKKYKSNRNRTAPSTPNQASVHASTATLTESQGDEVNNGNVEIGVPPKSTTGQIFLNQASVHASTATLTESQGDEINNGNVEIGVPPKSTTGQIFLNQKVNESLQLNVMESIANRQRHNQLVPISGNATTTNPTENDRHLQREETQLSYVTTQEIDVSETRTIKKKKKKKKKRKTGKVDATSFEDANQAEITSHDSQHK